MRHFWSLLALILTFCAMITVGFGTLLYGLADQSCPKDPPEWFTGLGGWDGTVGCTEWRKELLDDATADGLD